MDQSKYVLACGLSERFFDSDGSLYYHSIYDTFDEAFNSIDVDIKEIYNNRDDDEYSINAIKYYYKFMGYNINNDFLYKPMKVFYRSCDGKYLYAIVEIRDLKYVF